MFVQTEITPNPNSLKFMPGKTVSNSGSFEITKKEEIDNELVRNLLSINGVTGIFWQCPHGSCRSSSHTEEIKECERLYDRECAIFAKRRTVKWKNGINKGTKESKFNSKWNEKKIIAQLTELGFLGNATQKIEKIQTSQTNDNSDITKQLKNLIEMYESGAITKEEFIKAKKKLLN